MFAVIVITMVFTVISSIVNGFVLVCLWDWFIVPIFHLAPLTLVPAIGVVLVVSFLTHQYVPNDEDFYETVRNSFIVLFVYAAIFLVFGFIVHLFM